MYLTAVEIQLSGSLIQTITQVLHGCRQLVSWDVRLSPLTSATLAVSCYPSGALWWDCLGNQEEGGNDVKSSWPLCLGLHTCYNGRHKEQRICKDELISKNRSKFGLRSAIRPHEAEIASNRASERRGEYVLGPCTHRPSHHESYLYPKLP